MKIIAMIPARFGSKSIPNKNFRLLNGQPLFHYAISNIKGCCSVDDFFVNTESDLVADLGRALEAKIHIRPHKLSEDQVMSDEIAREFLESHSCDYLIVINPTSPLIRLDTLKKFVDMVKTNEFDTVLSVVEEKSECIFGSKAINFSFDCKKNSLELEPYLKVVWSMTAWRASKLNCSVRKKNNVFSGKIGYFRVPTDEAFSLTNPEDWEIAESILRTRSLKAEVKR